LLGILRANGRKEGIEAGEVAGDSGGMDAWVECAEECGHGAAAGAAEGSDTVGVYFGARKEVVDGADSIPSEGPGKSVADEGGLEANLAVFASGGFEEGFGWVCGVGVLEALALTDRVVGEDSEAVASEGAGEGVVGGFAGEAVAWSDDDGGKFLLRAGFGVGEIEESGDGEVRLGFVENLFDVETVGLRAAEDLGVEWGSFGEATEEGEDFFADFALAGFGLGAGGDGGYRCATGGGFFGGDVVEVVGELGAADVGGTTGVGADWHSDRWHGGSDVGCLRGEDRGGEKCGDRDEMEGSHRAAFIHRGASEVKRWSYQFGGEGECREGFFEG